MKPIYDNYEIHGCTEHHAGTPEAFTEQCPDSEAQFWTLYGHLDGQGVEAIGDFKSREAAEECYYRMTGQPFGSHDENKARVKLMNSADKLLVALWASLPFVESWSEWVNACEDYGEKSDEIDRQYGLMQDAYAEATGSRSEAIRITLGIEQMIQGDCFRPDEGDYSKIRPDFDNVPNGFSPRVAAEWTELDKPQKEYILRHYVKWPEASDTLINKVIQNVIAGKSKQQWFEGTGDAVQA